MKFSLKLLKYFFVLFFGLPLCLYVALVLVNIGEQDYSSSSIKKDAIIKSWASNIRDDNAYIYALGFASETPLLKGKELAQLIISDKTEWSGTVSAKGEYKTIAVSDSDELRQTCFRQDSRFCKADSERESYYFNSSKSKQLVIKNQKFIANYQQLITLSTWQEVAIDTNINMAYSHLLEGQLLYLIAVLQKLDIVDVQTTKNLLEMDIRFWRMTLSTTNNLITKMIAKSALERHFLYTQQALSNYTTSQRVALIPDSWHEVLTSEERSFNNVLIGEWGFQQKLYQNIHSYQDNSLFAQLQNNMMKPLYKSNNSLNLQGDIFDDYVQFSRVKYETMITKHSNEDAIWQKHCPETFNASYVYWLLYNPIGKFILCEFSPSYLDYVIKVADVEAIRRLTLLSLKLDSQQSSVEEQQAIITLSEYKDPYTKQPFSYESKSKTLSFSGFQSNDFISDKVSIGL